jgi:cytochrome c
MNDRANTIAGWVLAGGIVALGLSIVTGEYFRAERPEKMGYVVEGVEAEGGESGGAAAEQPAAFYLASADPAKGADVFKKCAACHNADKGGPNALGPNLYGVVGEPIGKGANGFAFSDALSSKGGNWDWDSLFAWLKSPKAFAPGTKMTFAGLSKPEDRANVIAYLNKQSDAPKPLPSAPPANADKGGAQANPAGPGASANPTAAEGTQQPNAQGRAPAVPTATVGEGKGEGAAEGTKK